ncbi:unnamed protein product, partial [Scytosiphon promiscuus]
RPRRGRSGAGVRHHVLRRRVQGQRALRAGAADLAGGQLRRGVAGRRQARAGHPADRRRLRLRRELGGRPRGGARHVRPPGRPALRGGLPRREEGGARHPGVRKRRVVRGAVPGRRDRRSGDAADTEARRGRHGRVDDPHPVPVGHRADPRQGGLRQGRALIRLTTSPRRACPPVLSALWQTGGWDRMDLPVG